MRADAMLENGDMEGAATWRRVVMASLGRRTQDDQFIARNARLSLPE